MEKDLIKPAAVLFLVTLIAAAVIGITYAVTQEPIQNQHNNTEMAAILTLLPATHTIERHSINEADSSLTRLTIGYDRNGEIIGYVFSALPAGYNGRINMMTALNLQGEILGIRIINHTETPGLGANITRDWFLGAFEGQAGIITNADVPIIASSTISVNAVLRGVNDAMDYIKSGRIIP